MRIGFLLIIFIVLFSCKTQKTTNKIVLVDNKEKSIKWFLKSESQLSTTYEKHNLRKELGKFYFKDSLIQIESEDYYYHNEIFDGQFLLTSINKKPNIFSSPALIPRDSVYILDLNTLNKSYISLKKINFAQNKTQLLKTYKRNIIINDSLTYIFAIDSINLKTNQLFLINPNFETSIYNLKSLN